MKKKKRNQPSSSCSGSKRKTRGDHKKEEEDDSSSHTSTERLSLEAAKEILQQLEEDVMGVIDESQNKIMSNHKNDPAEQDYFSDLKSWLSEEDNHTERHNTVLERFGRPKPNNYLLDAPHHYRTRSTTGTGIGTSSEKMDAKQIANNDLDAFNNIPSSIIEHILCFMPIKDAVRTSILSKNWRYRWTKIPKLEFDLDDMVDENQVEEQLFADWSSERKQLMLRCKGFFAVHQVLLMHQAPILDFSFKIFELDDACVEIEQMLIHLARRTKNSVKKLTFEITDQRFDEDNHYELPRSIFLLRNLTDLHIKGCTLGHLVPTLDGFGSLTSLFFLSSAFGISEKPLLQLLANCPLLKKLELLFDDTGINELQCINIIELFKCLPVIEDLSISQWIIKDCDYVPRELPIALVHLKRFCFSDMMLLDGYGLEFVFLVIRSSPNLEKIELEIFNDDYLDGQMYKEYRYTSEALKDCADIWLEHLKELEIRDFANLKHEMKFVKLILERAPMLKKVRIFQRYSTNTIRRDRELKTIRNVLRSSARVSPLAEIIVLRDD